MVVEVRIIGGGGFSEDDRRRDECLSLKDRIEINFPEDQYHSVEKADIEDFPKIREELKKSGAEKMLMIYDFDTNQVEIYYSMRRGSGGRR